MRRAAKVALGCLFAPVGLLVVGLIAFSTLRAAGVPDPDVGQDRIEQPLTDVPKTVLAPVPVDAVDPEPIGVSDGLRVELDMVEGMFRVEAFDGEEIEVDAHYDRATYRLDRSYGLKENTPVFRLEFASKLHWLRRLAADGSIDDDDFGDNEVTVYLPRSVPIDLHVKISRAEGEMVLDGLTLTNLVTELSMGQYSVESGAANPVVMRRAVFDLGMGETNLRGLSYLRAREIEIAGGMGEIRVDMGTSLGVDTVLKSRMRMGEMVIALPDDALYDRDSDFTAVLGEVDDAGIRSRRLEDPELARRLTVTGSVLMGELRVGEFRARGFKGPDLR